MGARLGSIFGAQKGPKMEPKCDPRGTKIEDKNEDEKRRFRRSSWSRLGAILARLGGRLGVIFKVPSRGAASHLGALWRPSWSQNGTQDGPKPKTKTKSKKDALEDRLRAVLGRSWLVLGVVLGPSWGRRIGFRLGETAFREKSPF